MHHAPKPQRKTKKEETSAAVAADEENYEFPWAPSAFESASALAYTGCFSYTWSVCAQILQTVKRGTLLAKVAATAAAAVAVAVAMVAVLEAKATQRMRRKAAAKTKLATKALTRRQAARRSRTAARKEVLRPRKALLGQHKMTSQRCETELNDWLLIG